MPIHLSHRLLIVLALLVVALFSASIALGASGASFDPTTLSGETIVFTVTPNADDGGGYDNLMLVCYDADGVPNDSDGYTYVMTSNSPTSLLAWCDPGFMPNGSYNSTATWKLFDIASYISENDDTVLPQIEASPLLACFGLGCAASGGILPILDGRLNAFDHGAPVSIYCVDGEYTLWDIGLDGRGTFVGSVSVADAEAGLAQAESSGENVQIAEIGDNSLWALAPGDKLQLMGADLREPGKMYEFIFVPRCRAESSEG
jgi:hypothetical protein